MTINIQMHYQTQKNENKQFWFFLLINTKSGGGWGKRYLTLKKKQFSFQYNKTTKVHVSLHDLLDKTSKQQALNHVKQISKQPNQQIRIVICGGDGTMIWGIQQTLFSGINLQKIVFGCIPIGTGNDFSRTLGWGSSPIKFQDSNIYELKKRIIQWLHSKTSYFDLWQIQIQTYEDGDIICVKNKNQVSIEKKTFYRPFSNYVGIGIDARVSYSFQKHRKSSKIANLITYGCLGCCKLFKRIQTIQNSFEQFIQKKPSSIKEKLIQKEDVQIQNGERQFKQELQTTNQNSQGINIDVKKGYRGLICLNSISYMAGRMNVWNTSKIGSKLQDYQFKKQQIDDGIIQFIGYKDQFRLGLQTIFHAGAKIAQGQEITTNNGYLYPDRWIRVKNKKFEKHYHKKVSKDRKQQNKSDDKAKTSSSS